MRNYHKKALIRSIETIKLLYRIKTHFNIIISEMQLRFSYDAPKVHELFTFVEKEDACHMSSSWKAIKEGFDAAVDGTF